jgi:hypothetical protein
MFKKNASSYKNAPCRWSHPNANGRTIDFDQKGGRKRTMRRAPLEMP